jgi:predicted membrane chloride channel (bestrophin family)
VAPRKILAILAYSLVLVLLCDTSLAKSSGPLRYLQLSSKNVGNIGTAIGGVLSMVTGLLLSYRSNQALRKWESGRTVWMVDVRKEVRDGLRMVSQTELLLCHHKLTYTAENYSDIAHWTCLQLVQQR